MTTRASSIDADTPKAPDAAARGGGEDDTDAATTSSPARRPRSPIGAMPGADGDVDGSLGTADATTPRERQLEERIAELEDELAEREELEAKIDRLTSLLDRVEAADDGGPPEAWATWTYDAFETYVASRPSTGTSTARSYRAELERLEQHDEAPVDLHPPDQDAWRRHVIVRKEAGQGAMLNLQRAALVALFQMLEEQAGSSPAWSTLETSFRYDPEPFALPPPGLVPAFWQHEFFPGDAVKTKLAQYLFRFGFCTGVRPPSELAVIRVDDVDLETREIRVRQPKKDGKVNRRPRQPEHLVSAGNAKSLRVWIETWRPRLDPDTDALFPDFRGQAWPNWDAEDPYNRLGQWLTYHGQKVWDEFSPYAMRHWFATTLQRQCRDVHRVADELGDTVSVVDDRYVDRAIARSAIDADWTPPPLGYQEGAP